MDINNFVIPLSNEFQDVFFIEGFNKGRYPYSHSMLIDDCLIDTGVSNKYLRKLKKAFPINRIILTHWHEDHILGNRILNNITYLTHPKAKPIIENVNLMYDYYGIRNTPAEKLFRAFMEGFKIENTKVNQEINDNDIIKINNTLELEVIYAPGHCEGHCCFYENNTKTMFLADIDLSSFMFYGCKDSNLLDFEHSIERIKSYDMEIAISGHKGIISTKKKIIKELDRYLNIIHKRDARILENFSENKTIKIEDLLNKNLIYKKYNQAEIEYELIAEKIMLEKHIEKFLKEEVITEGSDGYGFLLN